MGFEPTNASLGSWCLTTWRHPRVFESKFGHFRRFFAFGFSEAVALLLTYCHVVLATELLVDRHYTSNIPNKKARVSGLRLVRDLPFFSQNDYL